MFIAKSTPLSAEDFTAHKKSTLDDFKQCLFVSLYEQAHDIKKLEEDKTDEKVAAIDKHLSLIIKVTDQKIVGKVTPAQKEARIKAANSGMALQGQRTRLLVAKSDLYKKVAERAKMIQGYVDMIAFVSTFQGDIPALPFLDIEGTKYAASELGGYVKDNAGNNALFIEKAKKTNDKDNIPKKG